MPQQVENPPMMLETQETLVQALGQENPLQQQMVTTPIFLSEKTPWTEEPGRLQAMKFQSWT